MSESTGFSHSRVKKLPGKKVPIRSSGEGIVLIDMKMPKLVEIDAKEIATRLRVPLLKFVASTSVLEKVQLETTGVPSKLAKSLFRELEISDGELYGYLGLPKTTFHRRMTEEGLIDGAPGQTVIGFADLLLKLEQLLAEYGDEDRTLGFDSAKWLGEWLREPNAALGGIEPAELMRSPTGREAVSRALGANFSGSFQ